MRTSESSMRDEWPSAASCSGDSPSRRILRSMSNSRLRTKSLRRLRSIIALSSDFSRSSSAPSGWRELRSAQSVAGLATKRTTLRKKLSSLGALSDIRLGVPAGSIAEHLLLHLAALLRLERQRGGGAGEQAGQADRLAGFVAVAVVAGFDARQRLRDLLQQLALAVARAQLERMLFLDGRAVGRVGHDRRVLAQVLGGFAGVGQQVVLQR